MKDWIAFLQSQGGQLADSRDSPMPAINSFGTKAEELNAIDQFTWLMPLSDRGILALSGPDTDKLLQGQLSCDMAVITQDQAGSGALCTVKGRMISNFTLCRDGNGDTLLLPPQSLLQRTLDTLKKYAVFYKTTLSDQTDDFRTLGLAGPDATSIVDAIAGSQPSATCLHLDGVSFIQAGKQRWVPVVPAENAPDLWLKLAAKAKPAGLSFWHLLSIRDGHGEVRPETVEEFIPQMLNLQHTGAVNFRKGCYTGQEIVARMQYLGKLKRRMYRLSIGSEAIPAAGTEIFIPGETQNSGLVVIAAQAADNRVEVLAVLTPQAAAEPTLQLGDQPYSCQLLTLPYDEKFGTGVAK